MVAIFAVGKAQSQEFEAAFARYLRDGLGEVRGPLKDGCRIITDLRELETSTERVIAVFEQAPERFSLPPERVVAVVNSADENLVTFVSSAGLPAIPCGLRSRDTITLSSMEEDSAVIDLRRTITGFDGTAIEPQEIPVQLVDPPHKFALMAAAAVLLLTGTPPEGKM